MDLTLTIQIIRNCVKETFDVSNNVKTSFSNIIKLVIEKYPGISIEQIKRAMADIEGWRTSPKSVKDQIEITPTFFG